MVASQRNARRRGARYLALVIGAICASSEARADDPTCALSVSVEGVSKGPALAERLTALARREGACASQTWALRVAPGPNGTYVVALWNGTNLETRFASQPEVEPVASVLLRVALERQGQATASTAPSPPPPDTARPDVSPPSAVPAAVAAPTEAALSLGLEVGPAVSNAGPGGEAGLVAFAHGRHLGAGLFGRYGLHGGSTGSRGAFEAGAIGAIGTPLGPSVWAGCVIEVGLSVQRGHGEADGKTATASASGATIGGGVMALVRPTSHMFLAARLIGRWSSASTNARDLTSTTAKNKGNGNGNGANKTETTTTVDPASQNAVDALGGGALSLALGVGYAF